MPDEDVENLNATPRKPRERKPKPPPDDMAEALPSMNADASARGASPEPDEIASLPPVASGPAQPPRRIRPPGGSVQDLTQPVSGARRPNVTQELQPRPPRGAASGGPRPPAQAGAAVPPRPPPQAAAPTPPPPPPAPLTDPQREELSEIYRQVLAYAGKHPGHPSGDQALEAAREIGLLLR